MGRSRLYLRKLESPPATILEHLIAHFPKISAQTWRDRIARGMVTTNGTPVEESSPYRHGLTLEYEREMPEEPAALASESIVYQDDEILVADKPHGMPVTPAGDYVKRSLLFRLQQQTGCSELSPIHRLDRETAGLVLFSVNAASRARYHRLFEKNQVEREYLAVAQLPKTNQREWIVENRIAAGTPWFTQRIVAGGVNAITAIELIETHEHVGLFRLKPQTGKKHQLRVHMTSIGAPIVGDPYYPEVREKSSDEPPLQLLACRLAFEGREFLSRLRLELKVKT